MDFYNGDFGYDRPVRITLAAILCICILGIKTTGTQKISNQH